eukprot:scaffold94101_cov51-Phaeocystis_antarctica.AAC.1
MPPHAPRLSPGVRGVGGQPGEMHRVAAWMPSVFLLVRHARNALLRVPDDVRELGQPLLPPLAAGVLLTLPPGAQLLPCVLLLPGRPDTEC